MSLDELFPEATSKGNIQNPEEWLILEENGMPYYLPLASLSEREKALLTLKKTTISASRVSENPWYQYLVQKKGSLPQEYKRLQMIYIDHQYRLPEELVDFLATLLPNMITEVSLSDNRTILLLDQSEPIEVEELVKDVLPTLESDFGIKLTVFFGNSWSKLQANDLQAYFDEETKLFSDVSHYRGNERVATFSEMLLLDFARHLDIPTIKHKILQSIDDSKDIRAIIVAMWQEQGNLAKTAQSLYIHRNSLQYKLEKFRLLSGLNLKNLDSLAFCYLLIMMP